MSENQIKKHEMNI